MDRPDYGSRTPENMSKLFDHFGRREAPQVEGRMYEELCRGIAGDPELLRIAAHAPVTQPPPNLLFAAVHYLLLRGAQHPLRDYYPALRARAVRGGGSLLFREFRDFCLARRSEIEALVASRATQTNVVRRCTDHTLVTRILNLPFDTRIHYIAVHLHPFAESAELLDLTTGETVFKSEARPPLEGIGLAHVDSFSSPAGLPVYKDHEYELVSVYNNTSGVPQDSMAVMSLYMADRDFKAPSARALSGVH